MLNGSPKTFEKYRYDVGWFRGVRDVLDAPLAHGRRLEAARAEAERIDAAHQRHHCHHSRTRTPTEGMRGVRPGANPPRRRTHRRPRPGVSAGASQTTNHAATLAKGEWLFPLADDDLLLPGALEQMLAVSEGYDVVYSPPLVWGEPPSQFHGTPPGIPSSALIRTDAWRHVGGYNPNLVCREDLDLWERMLGRSKRFVCYDKSPTWVYRFHRLPDGTPGNKSRR